MNNKYNFLNKYTISSIILSGLIPLPAILINPLGWLAAFLTGSLYIIIIGYIGGKHMLFLAFTVFICFMWSVGIVGYPHKSNNIGLAFVPCAFILIVSLVAYRGLPVRYRDIPKEYLDNGLPPCSNSEKYEYSLIIKGTKLNDVSAIQQIFTASTEQKDMIFTTNNSKNPTYYFLRYYYGLPVTDFLVKNDKNETVAISETLYNFIEIKHNNIIMAKLFFKLWKRTLVLPDGEKLIFHIYKQNFISKNNELLLNFSMDEKNIAATVYSKKILSEDVTIPLLSSLYHLWITYQDH